MRNFIVFYCIFSLQSLIVTNDFRIWTQRTRWISRKSWTPDWFVSGKVKLLKILKKYSVINITRACTEIFPKPDIKKRHYLPTKDIHLRNFSVFYSIFPLQSLIVTNDLRIWTPRARSISRKSWTPDCFVSGKVKLLKIIKTDSVINITRACTEIFPKTDIKKTTLLTHQRQV